jgi:hypothetical protein
MLKIFFKFWSFKGYPDKANLKNSNNLVKDLKGYSHSFKSYIKISKRSSIKFLKELFASLNENVGFSPSLVFYN